MKLPIGTIIGSLRSIEPDLWDKKQIDDTSVFRFRESNSV